MLFDEIKRMQYAFHLASLDFEYEPARYNAINAVKNTRQHANRDLTKSFQAKRQVVPLPFVPPTVIT